MTYRGLEFASSTTPEEKTTLRGVGRVLQLAPHISEDVKMRLNNLPCFAGADTAELMREAEAKMGGKRQVGDRFTAMLVIAGTSYFDHPSLQHKRVVRDIGMPQYAK
jgi:hypothetical protein